MMNPIAGRPHRFPVAGELRADNTAVVVIDMQGDFCAEGGWVTQCGKDISVMREPIEPIRRVLDVARKAGLRIVHTREGYAPDLSDAPKSKTARYHSGGGPGIGDRGPTGRHLIRGEPCWNFIPELTPAPDETIIDKASYGAFYRTDLDEILKRGGIENLVLTGVTTDCCVNSTLREAEDRGYDCLVLADCCASPSPESHAVIIEHLSTRGIFGTVTTSEVLIDSLATETPDRAA